ncbi:MAG: hypothetical protein ACOC3I_01990, partial [Verrucomicrobiota bacterium]
TLLGDSGQVNLLNFSRPGAWADLQIRARNLILRRGGGGLPVGYSVEIDGIDIEVDLDFFPKGGGREIDLRILDEDGLPLAIAPRVRFDDAATGAPIVDRAGRGDTNGDALRTFDAPTVRLTADEFFGSPLQTAATATSGYQLGYWLVLTPQRLRILDTEGEDRVLSAGDPRTVFITNDDYKRVYAVYERVGDTEPPVVTSLELSHSDSVAGIATYAVGFNENVAGVRPDDFRVNGGAPGAGIRAVYGTGASRRVEVEAPPGTPLELELIDDDSIMDLAGNSLAGDGPGNGSRLAEVVIVESSIDLQIVGLEAGQLRLRTVAAAEDEVSLEVSIDLRTWTEVRRLATPGETPVETLVPMPTGDARVFYRAMPVE